MAQEMVERQERLSLHDYNRTIKDDGLRWGGGWGTAGTYEPPMNVTCTTSEAGGFLPTPTHRIKPEPIEWRCEGCGSVMLQEHRNCQECGKPRHFLYGDVDDG